MSVKNFQEYVRNNPELLTGALVAIAVTHYSSVVAAGLLGSLAVYAVLEYKKKRENKDSD